VVSGLEIGGGRMVQAGWVNLDPAHGAGEWRRRAQDTPWPCDDGAMGGVRASHVLEHIPAGAERIAVLNEVHRVLAPGGVFEVRVPDCLSGTWHAYADPTHVSFWCVESFHYLDGTKAAHADYGLLPWRTVELRVQGDHEVLWKAVTA
jgi:predicted SAM-dependent methyltransferase